MKFKNILLDELIKKGHEPKDGKRIWNIANRDFLYMTPKLSKSFLKLNAHPRYNEVIVKTETNLIKEYSKKFTGELSGNFNLIDMGCGNGEKAKEFIKTLSGDVKLKYCPVCSAKELPQLASKTIKKAGLKNVLKCDPHVESLYSLDEISATVRSEEFQKNIVILFGSILASFDIHEYLFNLSNAMFKGDRLIIGNGIRVGERLVNLDTYKHPVFQEWLGQLMKELGFKKDEAEYGVRFTNGRVEGFYKIKTNKKIPYKNREIEFAENDEIIVSALYKYYEEELKEFCKRYFSEVDLVKDKESECALVFCKK
ncbi:MAG: L-histidine N(alpha)-methyltransferase [Nanoarchaeota archaeon]|nr:L-histidine N(alpha)-methyltransferase [Nanoarchaeota archaeon]MBU1103400.1 L-histidine N(alpha)-methyltransferase [Nanoarchaeota archaeon]